MAEHDVSIPDQPEAASDSLITPSTPAAWRYAPDAWRFSRRLDQRTIDLAFRARSAAVIPAAMRARFRNLGLPPEIIETTLRAIHGLDEWSAGWTQTAQLYLGESRRNVSAGKRLEAEQARYLAAMSFHIAQMLELRDLHVRNNCRAWAANLARLALPVTAPTARHIMIPWRLDALPALFAAPDHLDEPAGLMVLLNGVSMSKEETFLTAPQFLEHGFAVLAIDSPGTGEATPLGPLRAAHDDIMAAIYTAFAHEKAIDLDRVVVCGQSLGGAMAVRIAARYPAVMAAIAITPPWEPSRWLPRANALLRAELENEVGEENPEDLLAEFGLADPVARMDQPLLVFGAARDVVVPPNESQLLARSAGEAATLVWYPENGHCLYDANAQWSWEAAVWAGAIATAHRGGETDPATLSAIGRDAILTTAAPAPSHGEPALEDDDAVEYARLITPGDNEHSPDEFASDPVPPTEPGQQADRDE